MALPLAPESVARAGAYRATARDEQALDILDDPGEWQAFSSAVGPEGVWESRIALEGMHCTACTFHVEQALLAQPGVEAVEVDPVRARARVRWNVAATRPSEWMGRLLAQGYRALPAHDAAVADHNRWAGRQMLWRWLVAGLCMMQIMMYATPVYLADPGEISGEVERLLRWACWVLSLPVMAFACQPFFRQAWQDLRARRLGMDVPVALGIVVTFVVSSAGTFEPAGPFGAEVYFDSLSMFVFILLSARWMEARLRERVSRSLDAALNRLPERAMRVRDDGQAEAVSVQRLRVGDCVQVAPGDVVVADGVVCEGHTHVDQAMLSGEAEAVARGPGDAVLAGSQNLSAAFTLRVTAIGPDTRHARIVALMEQAQADRPHAVQLVDRIAPWFLRGVLALALLAAIFWWPRGPGPALMIAAAVLVVTCPCALSIATPASLLSAAGRLVRHGIWVRRLGVLETLARTDLVVFDKTGTLTEGTAAVHVERWRPGVAPAQVLAWAAQIAAVSHHPVARSLVQEQQAGAAPDDAGERALKSGAIDGQPDLAVAGTWQARVEHAGQGIEAVPTTGSAWRLGSRSFCGVDAAAEHALEHAQLPAPAEVTRVYLRDTQGLLAVFALQERVRSDAHETVAALRALGVQVRMLSGDQGGPVAHVAAQLGVLDFAAAQSPADKLQALRAAQALGHTVTMVGDGLNDGPVLGGADAAIAMGQGVPMARSRADVVLLGEGLRGVAEAIVTGRRAMQVVRQNIAWAMAYNLVCVPLAMLGWLPAWAAGLGMGASSLLVLANALRLGRVRPGTA